MPGLFGILDPQKKLGEGAITDILSSMTRSLQHEDSYSTDSHVEDRLAIARTGKCMGRPFPCSLPDPNSDQLFFYGELTAYAGRDVLGTDMLPDILQAAIRDLPQTLATIDGSFAFAVYDRSKHVLQVVTDLTSSVPVYYAEVEGVYYFAPEVKALLQVPHLDEELDLEGVAQYLSTGMTYLNHTHFRKIRSITSASVMKFDTSSNQPASRRYWSFGFHEGVRDRGRDHYGEKLMRVMNGSLKRQTKDRDAKRIGLFLSGGYDSRAILGACLANGMAVDTVTHGVERDKPSSDALIARRITEKLGLENHFYHLSPGAMEDHLERVVFLTDGLTDQVGGYTEGLDNYRRIGNDFDVVLRGEELFGWMGGVFSEQEALASFGLIGLPSRYGMILRDECYQAMLERSLLSLQELSDTCDLKNLVNRKDFFVFTQGMPNLWGRLNYLKSVVLKTRTPFVDREMLECVAELPPRYRLYRNLFRESVRSAFPTLFEFDCATTSNLPNWRESYRKHEGLRRFIRTRLVDSSNRVFDEWVDHKRLAGFLGRYEKAAVEGGGATERLTDKAYESAFGVKELLTRNAKATLGHLVRRNYDVYRMALPILKHRRIGDSWLSDDTVLIRLLVLKTWSDLFVSR